jgi:biotin operon repressor
LLLDPETHTAIVLTIEGSDAVPMLRSFSLTPSATRVFLTLLQAYPHYSSFQSLFRSLYPSPPAQDGQELAWERALSVTPVRRALKALLPMLRSLGWQVVSLRGQGYVLARTHEASRQTQR